MTYFLTGATGFLGGVLARQLIERGHVVRAIVRTPAKADALGALGVELVPGDVTDAASMRGPMRGTDGVFHVAGWYKVGLRDSSPAHAVNVEGTRNVLGVMRELRIGKGVYTSTLAVNSDTHGQLVDETYRFDGRHLSVYDRTKAEAHRIAEDFIRDGLPLVIVQPGLIYGPGDTSGVRTTFLQFLQRKLPAVPRQTAFAWAHVEDVARGHVLAMERGTPGRTCFLAGPVHTFEGALDLAAEITGVAPPRLKLPPRVLRAASILVKPLERLVLLPSAFTSEGLRVIAGVTYIGTSARAQRELGWQARPLRDGLTETLGHEMALLNLPGAPGRSGRAATAARRAP
jgi:nucleoside-diphosphate-sugar epimerase